MRIEAENGATEGKFDLAKRAKAANRCNPRYSSRNG